MEEVDNIIIDSLRNIQCDIEESIHSLRDFNSDMVFGCIVRCLEVITPTVNFPQRLPPSMSVRLKSATTIAEHIKDLGYRGDMGYQTILYCNEVEIRRVLMFLVERLPRDTNKTSSPEELGYVPKLVKGIEKRLKLSLEKPWVPTTFLKYGVRDCEDLNLRQDFGHCYPLQTEHLQVSHGQNIGEEEKQYWVHLPDVSQQCSSKNLIPSLLFKDTEFSPLNLEYPESLNIDQNFSKIDNQVSAQIDVNNEVMVSDHANLENKVDLIIDEINERKSKLEHIITRHKSIEAQFIQINHEKNNKEVNVKEIMDKVKIKSKTLAVLSNEENMVKLKNLVDNGTNRLVELANQWNEIQTPLLDRYKEVQVNLSVQEAEIYEHKQRLENAKEKHKQLTAELKEKELLEQQLIQEYEKYNNSTNRSAYTQRILEIIGNIKKQNEGINKILKDTKSVQKDINTLSGQLDRSFALSDELIFRDAKQDEMARKAYKLLATIHTDCSDLLQAITDLGLVERECRNFQEQVDAEMSRETSTKLDRVNADLAEVRKETLSLQTANAQNI